MINDSFKHVWSQPISRRKVIKGASIATAGLMLHGFNFEAMADITMADTSGLELLWATVDFDCTTYTYPIDIPCVKQADGTWRDPTDAEIAEYFKTNSTAANVKPNGVQTHKDVPPVTKLTPPTYSITAQSYQNTYVPAAGATPRYLRIISLSAMAIKITYATKP